MQDGNNMFEKQANHEAKRFKRFQNQTRPRTIAQSRLVGEGKSKVSIALSHVTQPHSLNSI